MRNGEWGNGEWGMVQKRRRSHSPLPTPHSPFAIPHSLFAIRYSPVGHSPAELGSVLHEPYSSRNKTVGNGRNGR